MANTLIVFAALFSAISTAFVIESYKSLKQDPADASSQTLLTMSQTLMFIANGSQPTSFPPTSEMEAPPFKASAKAICVNVLWFLSLSVSVAVSLISMLAKEWCLEFIAGRTGPLGAQARRRQQRWDGILRWRMKEVIVTLPSLIHISLLLFAIGLCVFLWDVHFGVAIPVVFVTTFAAGAYFACTILPFLYNYCPYGTVLSRLLKQFTTFGSKPTRDVVANDEVTARALNWMIVNCETPRSVDIALQSLAAAGENLPPTVLDEYGAWSLVKLRHESVDMSEQSGHNRASNLYKRALEAYPLARRKVNKFWYGASDRTQRLEQLVLGIQATINSVIHELLSHADAVDDGTSNLLKRCTLIGRHFLDEGLRVDDLPGKRADWQPDGYEPYTYPLPVDPQRLAEDLVQILERYLRGQTDLDSVLYCALSASLAFVLCCNAARGLTDQSVNDISDNITGIKDVASSTPLFWTAVEILVDHSPWDDRYFLPTPEIYVFAVNSICLTGA
ncbi:hypothetical protein B0J17DRAFT_722934 [Rhizoctonia solani]|nr:hypothetical protein B0J17DRAFT_722934 [Rhizoctonia solani]